ncbi:MAG: sugar ABC transporter permease [Fimbriimonadaceae bacterium]|nr:sugar ABC transporter permease [Fimbriimonadaceae bacterium]
MTARAKQQVTGWILLLPYLAFFAIFVVVPVIVSGWLSVVQLDLANAGASKFVGLQNYSDALKDNFFWMATQATGKYAILMVPSVLIVGTAMALGMNSMKRGRDMARTLIYLPSMLNVAATGILWQWFFNNEFGLFNYGIRQAGGQGVPWLTDANMAMPSVVLMSLWWTVGGTSVIVLTALQQIPKVFLEAAALDGARNNQIFGRVTLPLLKPVLLFVFVTTTITSFQMFGQAMILTGGGPTFATRGLVQFMFETAFNGYRFGYGAAISWLLFAMIAGFSVLQAQVLKVREAK